MKKLILLIGLLLLLSGCSNHKYICSNGFEAKTIKPKYISSGFICVETIFDNYCIPRNNCELIK